VSAAVYPRGRNISFCFAEFDDRVSAKYHGMSLPSEGTAPEGLIAAYKLCQLERMAAVIRSSSPPSGRRLELAHPVRLQTLSAADALNRTHTEPRQELRSVVARPIGEEKARQGHGQGSADQRHENHSRKDPG
jgi:hypothetical protein